MFFYNKHEKQNWKKISLRLSWCIDCFYLKTKELMLCPITTNIYYFVVYRNVTSVGEFVTTWADCFTYVHSFLITSNV